MTIGAKRPHGLPLVGLIQSEPEDQGRGWGKRCPSPRRVGDKSLCLLFHSALSGLDGFHSTGGEGGGLSAVPRPPVPMLIPSSNILPGTPRNNV